jgi:tetratricopeptide (TPR) repeat protein
MIGSIHRLQQAVLRSRNFSIGGEVAVRDKLEQCIGAVDEMWDFKSDNPSTWEECGTVLFHVQAIVDHVQKYSVQLHIARRFSVILTEAALYSTQVLSRFDFAQTLLENASIIQDEVQDIGNVGSSDESMDPLELLEERSNTMHTLGKVLRIRGDFYKGEKMLQSALEMRGLSKSSKICDTLHELGVLNMKIHEYPIALVYLTDSLALKQELSLKLKQLVDTSEAATLHQLAVIFTAESNYDEAERLLLLALELESEDDTCNEKSIVLVNGHERTIDRPKLKNSVSRAATVQQLGRVALRQGKLVEADLRFNDALQLYLGAYGKEKASRHINVAAVHHQLGYFIVGLFLLYL